MWDRLSIGSLNRVIVAAWKHSSVRFDSSQTAMIVAFRLLKIIAIDPSQTTRR